MKSQNSSRKPKILVVDDEPDNLDLLYRTFYREYKVLRAESGPAALKILSSEAEVSVIISDQRMPEMSGTEFLSLTAVQYPDIIRIILTGYTDVEDLVEAINTGKVFKFLTKPWQAEELKAVVRQALDTHNVLKVRTEELGRALRRESLLNSVTNTIRNAQYGRSGDSPLRQVLQTIVNTVGHMLEVDICLLRSGSQPLLGYEQSFIYQKAGISATAPEILALTVWETEDVKVINDLETQASEAFSEQVAIADSVAPENHESVIKQRREAYQQANIRSSLIVPLMFQLDLMAVLALHKCGEPQVWEDDEIQLAVMVADQAALAIAQARSYEQVKALAKREALVNTITTAIRSTLDPQEIFTAITTQLGQALEVDGCALSLWTEADEFVQCVGLYDATTDSGFSVAEFNLESRDRSQLKPDRTHHDLPDYLNSPNQPNFASSENFGTKPNSKSDLPQSYVPITGNPVLQQLISTQQPVVLQDLNSTPEMKGFDLPLRSLTRALLLVPLIVDGKIIGSISLRQNNRSRRWSNADIDLAQAVASQAAIAVQQSRLYQKTRSLAERLLELDRQKTEFFQNVSHEFRTPLTLMLGPLEAAANNPQGMSPAQAAIALRNCRRLLRLVNQLLDLQRLDAGRMQASFRPCNLLEFTEQIVETFRPYCQKKGLNLQSHLQSCPRVYLDVEKFDKVLYNLLSNAMKFTETGGTISISLEPAGDHIRLQVKDTGIGISPSQIPHLFDRFRQAEGSINRSYEGSGLGLALVQELVHLHGGQVSVESLPGKGSTFTVWLQTGTAHLPLDMVLEVNTEVQAARATVELADLETELLDLETSTEDEEINDEDNLVNENAALILVVDDNPDLRTYVGGILREAGYRVCTAKNGAHGFEVTRDRRPQLIITDLMMPVVSGLELIASIRAEENVKGTPIILLTAKADETSRISGTEQGADAYLSKPFNDRELLAEVRNLLALKENEQKVRQLNEYLTEAVLKRFLPRDLVKAAATGKLELDLRPEPRLVTILFSDIVGFTQLSNTLRARRIAQLLNEYLEAMSEAVFVNGGTVDKFMGDAIIALFGAPEELPAHEQIRRAIASARAMYSSLEKLNQRWQEQGIVGGEGKPPWVQFRCGIHQGSAVVGMFGSEGRADYTAIGPAVNIAARLQEATDPDNILVSATVADYLADREITKCTPLKLKGIDETVLTFSVAMKI
ncbi:MAG: response regulator [Oscillatoria sp. PMC 1068.18]|nr:response regulator [Oscillatoria sp. PMC 1076.18]MEC4990252.1 response regulator [Oscillatoria sp. PMC 1068.18]